jgi:hypothetical protein
VCLDQPRKLAAVLALRPEVSGLKLTGDDTLLIETTAPDQICDALPGLLLERDIVAREITLADDSLEAVFGYLTDRNIGGGGVR